MKSFFFVAPFALLIACSSSSSDGNGDAGATTGDAQADASVTDSGGSSKDGAVPPIDASTGDAQAEDAQADAAPATDGATASCSAASDCRLFSSDCETCTCIPLSKTDPDPTCTGTTVSCFIDPCEGKSPTCSNNKCGGQ